jgi:hypothetical protein
VAALETRIIQEAKAHRIQAREIRVPAWRNAVDIQLGAAKVTVPPDGRRTSKPQLRAFRHPLFLLMTLIGRRRRWSMLEWAGQQLLGDVLSYERHRAEIHASVLKPLGDIEAANVVVVGHSLGGIALVDLLADPEHKAATERVRGLLTVGSQSPLMYAFDALSSLPYRRHPGRRPFTPWINIWDQNDFASFLARDIFHEHSSTETPILDIEVQSGLSFRDAHGAYWDQPATWAAIDLLIEQAQRPETVFVPEGALTSNQFLAFNFEMTVELVKLKRAELGLSTAENEHWLRGMREKMAIEDAQRLIEDIQDKDAERRTIEETGASYYRTDSGPFVFVTGAVDSARVRQLMRDYEPLRGSIAGAEPWLTVVTEYQDDVTDEARAAFSESSVRFLARSRARPPTDQGPE